MVAPPSGMGSDDEYRDRRHARQSQLLAGRRRILLWVIGAATGAFSLALLLPALALRSLTREIEGVAAGDVLVYAAGDRAGLAIDPTAIQPGTAVQAFPEGKSDNERNLIELVRLGSELPAGLVAYSAICTHLGCTVLAPLSNEGYIICPCHASVFNPAAGAQVISGPANRPLPGLPLALDGGRVEAAGGFDGPIGPD